MMRASTISTTETAPAVALSIRQAESWLTVERAIFGLVLLIAAGVRFFLLTDQPLNALEAMNSWPAWLVANGEALPITAAPNSPLLHSLYTLSFLTFGGGDALVRTIAALCGIGTIWLLWGWRDWLGRPVALLAAALMAFDPWLVAYSRLGDSVAVTLFLGMAVLTALLQLVQQHQTATSLTAEQEDDAPPPDVALSTHWQQGGAVAFGLLLVSGPQMWNWLIILALFVVIVTPLTFWQQLARHRYLWLLTLGAAIVGATGWLAYPEGLGAISTSLTVWLQRWAGGDQPYPLAWFWIRLITDLPLALLFGMIGLAQGWRQTTANATRRTSFLTAWLIWGLVLCLAPGRSPLVLAMVGLPLLFFAAIGLSRLWHSAQSHLAWRENGLLAVVLGIIFISFAFLFANFSNTVTFDVALARNLVLILVLMVLLILAYALWLDGRQARLVVGSGVALFLALWTFSSMGALNHHFDIRYPDGFFASATDPDVKRLVTAIAMLSAQRHGDATEMAIQVQMNGAPDPVLGWYLRDMRNLSWVLAPGEAGGQSPPVVVTPAGAAGIDGLRSAYLGSSYAIRNDWLPTALIENEIAPSANPEAGFLIQMQERLNILWTARLHSLLRWMIYHKIPTLPPTEQVVLWVANTEE
jgi:hypothetical protein